MTLDMKAEGTVSSGVSVPTSLMDESPLSTAFHQAEITPASVNLSTRERTVLLLMGRGLSNKTIARELSIAPETVKSHAKHIFWKLTARTRAQAVYRAAMLGLI